MVPGGGLLDRVGTAGELPERRNSAGGPFQDGRDDLSGRDELQQRVEEGLALVFGVVRAGKLVADLLELQRSQGEAFAFDSADDFPRPPAAARRRA